MEAQTPEKSATGMQCTSALGYRMRYRKKLARKTELKARGLGVQLWALESGRADNCESAILAQHREHSGALSRAEAVEAVDELVKGFCKMTAIKQESRGGIKI